MVIAKRSGHVSCFGLKQYSGPANKPDIEIRDLGPEPGWGARVSGIS